MKVNPEWEKATDEIKLPPSGMVVGVFSRLAPDGTREFGEYVLGQNGETIEVVKSQT